MSGLGIPQTGLSNILNLARPDLAAEQMQVQQRQAFANSLLQQQPQYIGMGGALDTLGSKLLGALTARSANKSALAIANQYRDALFNPQGGQGGQQPAAADQPPVAPPLSSMPPTGMIPPTPGQPNSGVQARPMPPLGSLPPGGLQAPPQPQQVAGNPVPAPMGQPQGQQQQPQSQPVSLFDRVVPNIPGMDNSDKLLRYSADPAGYMKAYYAAVGQTPEYKNALVAAGGDPTVAQSYMAATQQKSGAIEGRNQAAVYIPDGKGGYTVKYGPNAQNNTFYETGPHNEPIAHPIQGGAEAAAANEAAIEHAKELNSILPDVPLSDGSHKPMFGAQAVGGPAPSAGAAQTPGGLPAPENPNAAPNPAPSFRMSNPAATIQGIIGAPVTISSANRTPEKNAAVGGVQNSAHLADNTAFDFVPQGISTKQAAAQLAQSGVPFDQIIDEGSHVHVSFAPTNRRQILSNNSAPADAAQPTVGSPSTAQAEVNKAAGEAAANAGHVKGSSDALLKAIDGMIAINDQVPDSTFLSPETKAYVNSKAPTLPGFRGDAGALQQWEQMNSIGILGGIKNLGMGRTDIPIVKQVVAGGGIPASIPAADRIRLLQTLRTEVMNNKAAAQNTAANLNAPNAATPAVAQMQTYPGAKTPQRMRTYNPQTGRIE